MLKVNFNPEATEWRSPVGARETVNGESHHDARTGHRDPSSTLNKRDVWSSLGHARPLSAVQCIFAINTVAG